MVEKVSLARTPLELSRYDIIARGKMCSTNVTLVYLCGIQICLEWHAHRDHLMKGRGNLVWMKWEI